MEKKDLGLGIGATLLGIATMIYFFNIPPKSAFFPKMISPFPKRRSPMTESV